jgi:hypothetical protein
MSEIIPDYAGLLRRAAANHAADATRYADREQKLTTELGRFEEWMHAEHARIQAELNEAQAKADEQLRSISMDWEARKRDLAEAGRAKAEHQKHATGAERSWRNWCQEEGVDPDALPPLRDTGPLPVVPAEAKPVERYPDEHGWKVDKSAERAAAGLPPEVSQPLPVIPDPADLLALGKRMADPSATITDPPTGGEVPTPGDFQGEADRA